MDIINEAIFAHRKTMYIQIKKTKQTKQTNKQTDKQNHEIIRI